MSSYAGENCNFKGCHTGKWAFKSGHANVSKVGFVDYRALRSGRMDSDEKRSHGNPGRNGHGCYILHVNAIAAATNATDGVSDLVRECHSQ
ncbi:unnamed protein product [Haemonchus placei]|uniref:Protein Wnt n=1 Tax=Haemonchus placei TaxID=6290 RepID=A0A0N4WW31_HAEPC|nr:unnamed protein product [Haemonchus placei]